MPRHGDEDAPEPAEAADFVGWTLDPQNWGRLSTAVESALPEYITVASTDNDFGTATEGLVTHNINDDDGNDGIC